MKAAYDAFRQLHGPPGIDRIPGDPADAVKGMHPLGQVVVVLPVLIPFQALVGRFVRPPFVQPLADPQAAPRRVQLALGFVQSADPAAAGIIGTVAAKDVMHLVDELQGEITPHPVIGLSEQFQQVAERKGIRPEIPPWRFPRGRKPGDGRIIQHDRTDL